MWFRSVWTGPRRGKRHAVNVAFTHGSPTRCCGIVERCASSPTPGSPTASLASACCKSSTWDLVRHRIVTDHAYKVGAQPGVALFLEANF
jgi:hypothetical protein